MKRPILHLYITQPQPGVISARGVLETPTGPVEVTASVPVALLHALIRVHRAEGIGAEPEVGSLWGSISHAVSHATQFVSHAVVKQAIGIIKTTRLPALMGKITARVAALTGTIPLVGQVTKIFDTTAQALLGNANAKDVLKQLGHLATSNPAAWIAWETAKLTSKVLPAVRQIADPLLNVVPGGKSIQAAVDAVSAATHGDLSGAWSAALRAAPLVPGLGQAVAVYRMADAVRRGQWENLAKSAASLTPQGAMAVQAYDTARQVMADPRQGAGLALQAARGQFPQLPAFGG